MYPCCTLRYEPVSGAIHFDDADPTHGPTMAERRHILSHFTLPVTALKPSVDAKGRVIDDKDVIPPGSEKHFRHAAYQLPIPFGRMPS